VLYFHTDSLLDGTTPTRLLSFVHLTLIGIRGSTGPEQNIRVRWTRKCFFATLHNNIKLRNLIPRIFIFEMKKKIV